MDIWKAGLASIYRASGSQGSQKPGFQHRVFSQCDFLTGSVLAVIVTRSNSRGVVQGRRKKPKPPVKAIAYALVTYLKKCEPRKGDPHELILRPTVHPRRPPLRLRRAEPPGWVHRHVHQPVHRHR